MRGKRFNVYVRAEDMERWENLTNRSEWIHNQLKYGLTTNQLRLKVLTDKSWIPPKEEEE